jgi:hypothetical protein
MKMKKNTLLPFALFILASLPHTSFASTAILINDTTLLYTIDFAIDDKYFANEIPIAAQYGVEYNDRVDTLGYTIAGNKNTDITLRSVSAAVLSKSAISGDRYVAPKGMKTDYKLLILATFSEKLKPNSYQARITKFPYFVEGRRTTVHQNQLDELAMPKVVVPRTMRQK